MIELLNAEPVNVDSERLGPACRSSAGGCERNRERPERKHPGEQPRDEKRRSQVRERDVPERLERRRAVNFGGLVHVLWD